MARPIEIAIDVLENSSEYDVAEIVADARVEYAALMNLAHSTRAFLALVPICWPEGPDNQSLFDALKAVDAVT